MEEPFDTIIIGAGWSGAVAAQELSSAGRRVLVLEARDRLGGRAYTLTEGMHAPIDLGCSWIHGYKEGNPARDIAQSLSVATHVLQSTESFIWGEKAPLHEAAASILRNNLTSALAQAKSLARDSRPEPTDLASLSTYLFSSESPLVSDTPLSIPNPKSFARTLEVPFGVPLESTSLRWYAWESAFAGSDAGPEGGFQALIARVIAEAQKNSAVVRLDEPVIRMERRKSGECVVHTNKGTHTSRSVICTIPLGVLKQTAEDLFVPGLPPSRLATIARTRVGVLEKLVLAYPHAWWPNATTAGSFTFLPHRGPKDGDTVQEILNSHTISVASFAAPMLPTQHATLLFYLSPGPALSLAERFSSEELRTGAHEFLVNRLGVSSTEVPVALASRMTNWHNDPHSQGATSTPVVVGEGQSPLDFAELGKPLWDGVLGFAGEHTDMDHRGSVAGAIISGRREAARVLRLLRQWEEST